MKLNRAFFCPVPRATAAALAVSAALCAAPFASSAQDQDASKADNPKFVKFDRNRDGFLTRNEVRHIREYGKAFDQADENKDGKLDASEFIKAEAIHDRILAGKFVDDSVITAKVKAALLKEQQLKALDVSVETYRGEVLLSGFVQDETQRNKALRIALAVNGVSSVKDGMAVR